LTIIFKIVLSSAKRFLLLRNNIFYDCIVIVGLILKNKIKYAFKHLENTCFRCCRSLKIRKICTYKTPQKYCQYPSHVLLKEKQIEMRNLRVLFFFFFIKFIFFRRVFIFLFCPQAAVDWFFDSIFFISRAIQVWCDRLKIERNFVNNFKN